VCCQVNGKVQVGKCIVDVTVSVKLTMMIVKSLRFPDF